jgi:hypothetical protein
MEILHTEDRVVRTVRLLRPPVTVEVPMVAAGP